MKYILRQLSLYLAAVWASLTINFLLPRTMPGDPVTALVARMRGQLTPSQIEAVRAAFGFNNDPLWKQYLQYLSHAIRLDFGLSISSYPVKVSTIIGTGLYWTILLGTVTLVLSFVLGTVLGVVIAWRRGGLLDSTLPGLTSFFGSFPYFWLAMVALFFLGFELGWFPMAHAYSDDISPGPTLEYYQSVGFHIILPALTIILVSVGGWMMGMRSTMIAVLDEDYITMAEAKGLSQWRVMFGYAMRNAILPNFTQFGMSVGFILSGQLLTEMVFSYPGLGFYLVRAVTTHDYPLMQALFFMITLAVLGANLIVDLLYIRLDPRVRAA
ncbi:MAG TPA: ABC transporter permease [Anaerolineaceae bacterium]|nr:ABC transporter permease [Anaerolineaceae bacterium]